MFAKGPMPGYSPKKEALNINPGYVCKKRCWNIGGGTDLYGYCIFPVDYKENDKPLLVAKTSREAWEKLYILLKSKT